jgi:zinc transport system ATP-binding protein
MTARMEKLLEIKNIWAGYGTDIVLREVSMSVFRNDFIGIIGPNGGGKTTLIKIILGLLKPMKGSLWFGNNEKGSNIGYLPQVSQVDKRFPIRVIDIVLSGLMSSYNSSCRFTSADKKRAAELLEQMGIAHISNRTAQELSGGQLQRVFICRALIASPGLLILDEPNTYVDNRFESELYDLLIRLNKEMAIMIVSHDVGTISAYVKTIACVNTYLHYHPSNTITEEELAAYDCPLQIITHGDIPHTILQKHDHSHES